MNKYYPWKQAFITGLVVGTFAVCAFSLADSLNKHYGWGVNPASIRGLCGLLTIVILGTGIYTAMQSTKKANNGTLIYKQAILAGVIVAVTTGIITALLGFIYCEYLNPGYAAYMAEEGKKAMITNKETPAEIAKHTAQLRAEFSTGGQMMQAIIAQSVIGTLISLMMGIFVRTKKQ